MKLFAGASGASGSTGPSGSNGAAGGHLPSLLPSTFSRLCFTNCKRCVCLQACPARVAVQAPQVCTDNTPCACHAASCLTWAGSKLLVTLQARPAQTAAQDLLASTVQLEGTFQVGYQVPSSTQSLTKVELLAGVSGASGSAGATGVHCQLATSLPCSPMPKPADSFGDYTGVSGATGRNEPNKNTAALQHDA